VTVTVTHPERVLFPDAGITKGDLVAYYEKVADAMVPHLEGRPLTMQRYHGPVTGEGFFQKSASDHFPPFVERATVPKGGKGTITHPVVASPDALVYLANQGMVTAHVWLARADRPLHPDRLVLDLDPSEPDLALLRRAARAARRAFEEVGLVPHLAATGSRGFHVTAPLDRSATTEEAHAFAADLATLVASRDPDELTTAFSKAERGGRLFLDANRNGYAQTVVAPWSVRARPGAGVAVPLRWEELGRAVPDRFTVKTAPRRLATAGDPWATIDEAARPLAPARQALDELLAEAGAGRS
jgi:bifunctional non-homologous end joining protein LigD